MIHSEVADQDIATYVHKTTVSIQQSARELVLEQQTSLEEVLRVTQV